MRKYFKALVKLVDTKDLNPCPFGSASSSLRAPLSEKASKFQIKTRNL